MAQKNKISNIIENKYITQPTDGGDGISLYDGQHWIIQNCVVDLSDCDLDDIDEALGITYGSSANVKNCVFRGAGKLILCGCGDKDKIHLEEGKEVVFENCIFENFGRRGPEVQDGMNITLRNCLIRNWGDPDRFDTRNFAAWAHHGGSIVCENCIFWQDTKERPTWQNIKDKANHIGQAVNYAGVKALFEKKTYIPGVERGLIQTNDGAVYAKNVYRNKSWIYLDNVESYMPVDEALSRIEQLEAMKDKLYKKLVK